MEKIKRWLPDVIIVALFAVVSFAYFIGPVSEGKILYRHDSSAGVGSGQEIKEYREQTGEQSRWTNSLFSGMPTYQMAPSYKSSQGLGKVINAYHLWLPDNVWYIFAYLLGFYILLRAFDFRRSLAALGSVIWAFSSYFFIIIAAGHIWKVMALCYLPPMIAGVVLAYRGKYLWGFIVTAIFAAFEVNANHVQMTYYYLFIIAFMVIGWLVDAIREKKMAHFLKATAVCAVAGLVGLLANISNLYHTWEYTKESMRGKSELVKKDSSNQSSSGLDRDYITQWSYGISETFTLLIPNMKGGASVPMSENEIVQKKGDYQYQGLYEQIGQYWGEQPGTSGPVYVGAFVVFLFILGLFIVKGSIKWALLAATVLSILLSWGKNFMPLTDFFIDYFPMYSKFRTVASILVIAEFTMPLLAIMALKKFIEAPKPFTEYKKPLIITTLLTIGLTALFAVMPTMFDYVSSSEMKALSQFPADQLNPLLANLREVRQAIFTSDCWRSIAIILICLGILFGIIASKADRKYAVICIAVVCLIDMWMVNKRYLNDGMFVESTIRDTPQQMTDTDKEILKDKSLDYRVLNFASNTFNENETSYYHKSVGGYHAAKLRRYQDLIEAYISPEMQTAMNAVVKAQGDMNVVSDSVCPVINMLNTKYFILPMQDGTTMPLLNPKAFGNGWFVDKVRYVANANEELDGIKNTDLRHAAVADKRFEQVLGSSQQQDTTSIVKITSYKPNELHYDISSKKGGVVVLSEVYYPGWTATVDGLPVEIGRVNYLLRAINVKPGNHKVVLEFRPSSVATTEAIAWGALIVLVLSVLFGLFKIIKK
ncbi:MAG: YfhO family protein [Prevotella sp.]|nr:YfhO family protein [Prevotella sp.]